MAARHLQRLRGSQVEIKDQIDETSEEEDEISKPPFNPFELLSDEEGADEEPESWKDKDHIGSTSTGHLNKLASISTTAAKSTKKSKKKTNKSVASRVEQNILNEQQNDVPADDSLDKLLAELDMHKGDKSVPSTSGNGRDQQDRGKLPLLAVDPKRLRGEEEMRRIFGVSILREEERNINAEGIAGANRRTRRAIARGQLRRQPLKRGLLVAPKDTWPRFDGGISMELAGTANDGSQIFRYTHSAAYQGVQALFEECQATFNPNNIAGLLAHHPYHVDSLMAMYELHRATGQHEYADEMLQRCLYALEMAWHPWFNPVAASCRLSYAEEQNRPLFSSLFKHMQGLSRKGLHTTAFEVAKLILMLDPDDPMGVMLCIDYFALRAHNYSWLQRLAEENLCTGQDGCFTAASLPSLAFSVPLAQLRILQQRDERAHAASARASKSGGSQVTASANDSAQGNASDELQASLEALTQGVLLHPAAVAQLMKRLQEKGVGNDQEWLSILRHPLFSRAADGMSTSLQHLVDIFVERQHLLWKVPDAQQWLKQACKLAIEGPMANLAKDFACAREQAFPPRDENAYSHLRLSDFSDAVAALPPEELQAAVLGPNRAAGGQRGQQQLGQAMAQLEDALAALAEADGQPRNHAGRQAAPVDEETLQQMHPLHALLRTLLPWVNAGETPDYAAEDVAAVPGRHPQGEMDREATEALALQIQAAYEELQAEQDNNELDHARDRH